MKTTDLMAQLICENKRLREQQSELMAITADQMAVNQRLLEFGRRYFGLYDILVRSSREARDRATELALASSSPNGHGQEGASASLP